MSPLALAPAAFSGGGKSETPPIDTSQNNNVKAIRNEIQQIHNSQQAPQSSTLGDYKPTVPQQQKSEIASPVQEFDSGEAQYTSLTEAMTGHRESIAKRGGQDELLHKLDKILFLLEEQRDQKTGHVTEEVILYSFIGIFIIFVLDSFARAGKYVR